jgi:DNA-binding NarL/FixJ family response regulator
LLSDEPSLRLRAQRVLDAIQQTNFADLGFVKDPHIRAVLMQLLAERALRREGLPLLFARLTTAEHQHTPNATLVAVFGLYVAGLPREAIAARLGYSVQLVRNYVGEIYARFGLTQQEWPERRVRWERLRALAQEAGFV